MSKGRFVSFDAVCERIGGKRVAIVGSAPSVLENAPGFVDSHDVVVRVNNYKTGSHCGYRTDVYYSYFGGAIKKRAEDLARDGVTLCMCKCPDGKPIESPWHERNGKVNGIDFRWIYTMRRDWWFCPVWIPTVATFREKFDLLDGHVPTTGFAAILDVLACHPASLFLTGFDFFTSGVHNVNEKHRPGDPTDPIQHRPDLELDWLARNSHRYPISLDATLSKLIAARAMEIAA